MDIVLDSGARIALTWRNSAELHIALVGAPSGAWDDAVRQWPISASTTLRGEDLMQFLEVFIQPLMRRCLTIAVQFPKEIPVRKTGHTT
jgi:hypothetical protein